MIHPHPPLCSLRDIPLCFSGGQMVTRQAGLKIFMMAHRGHAVSEVGPRWVWGLHVAFLRGIRKGDQDRDLLLILWVCPPPPSLLVGLEVSHSLDHSQMLFGPSQLRSLSPTPSPVGDGA
jgi:hypothetical protein